MDEKKKLFKTAKAIIGCNHFNADEFVGIEYYFTNANGVDWFIITDTERGVPPITVAYPETHLTNFCL